MNSRARCHNRERGYWRGRGRAESQHLISETQGPMIGAIQLPPSWNVDLVAQSPSSLREAKNEVLHVDSANFLVLVVNLTFLQCV